MNETLNFDAIELEVKEESAEIALQTLSEFELVCVGGGSVDPVFG